MSSSQQDHSSPLSDAPPIIDHTSPVLSLSPSLPDSPTHLHRTTSPAHDQQTPPPIPTGPSVPATPAAAHSEAVATIGSAPDRPYEPTLADLCRFPDIGAAEEQIDILLVKDDKPALRTALFNAISALLKPVLRRRLDVPRLDVIEEGSIKDLCVQGGKGFEETSVQKVLRALYARTEAPPKPQQGIYQVDLVIMGASCNVKSSLKASGSQRSTTARNRQRARVNATSDQRSRYYCAYSLVVEVKTSEPFRQLMQLICYALQSYQRCGCRLGLGLQRTYFARVLVLDEETILLENSNPELQRTAIRMKQLGSKLFRAVDIYPHNLRLPGSIDEDAVRNPESFRILQHLVQTAIDMLGSAPQAGGPSMDDMLRASDERLTRWRESKEWASEEWADISLGPPEAPADVSNEDLVSLVQGARRNLREVGASAESSSREKRRKDGDDEEEEEGEQDRQRGSASRTVRSQKKARHAPAPEGSNAVGVDRQSGGACAQTEDSAGDSPVMDAETPASYPDSLPHRSSDGSDNDDGDDDDEGKIVDDREPISFDLAYRVLFEIGITMLIGSPADMSEAVGIIASAVNLPTAITNLPSEAPKHPAGDDLRSFALSRRAMDDNSAT